MRLIETYLNRFHPLQQDDRRPVDHHDLVNSAKTSMVSDRTVRIATVSQEMMFIDETVRIFPHDPSVVDQQEHEDEDDGEDRPVDHLGVEHDADQRHVGQEDDPGAEKDHQRIEAVELGGLQELAVEARLPSEGLADRVGGRDRKDGGGKERGVQEAEGEQPGGSIPRRAAPAPGRRPWRFRSGCRSGRGSRRRA